MLIRTHARPGGNDGTALLLAVVLLTIVGSVGLTYLGASASFSRRNAGELDSQRAFYLAEAGLAEAFYAVRVGRTGQIGAPGVPAVFGDGALWVDASKTADGQVRLESVALYGAGRASLALVVEPVEEPLGFFSDEDLVVESVVLMDGFDSSEATYEAEIAELVETNCAEDVKRLQSSLDFMSSFIERYGFDLLDTAMDPYDVAVFTPIEGGARYSYAFGEQEVVVDLATHESLNSMLPELVELFPDGEIAALGLDGADPMSAFDVLVSGAVSGLEMPEVSSVSHTDGGGLLASNGNVHFGAATGEAVEVFGDVLTGPDGEVHGLGAECVSGSMGARDETLELPEVDVPSVALAAPVRHEGLLPMQLAPGTSGHERIEVAMDAELIIRGPATVVIGSLVLEPGAVMTLDTGDGEVQLFVTGGMDLQEGSFVTTSGELPEQLTVQVGEIAAGSDPAINLEATSSFHGTIYAPDADVRVGGDFEVFGGIVARRLEIGAGAKLHFDSAGYARSPIPDLISWRIIETPSAVKDGSNDPFAVLGVDAAALVGLNDAHDLTGVELELTFLDSSGATREYSGPEVAFDWTQVDEVVEMERDRELVVAGASELGGAEAGGGEIPDWWNEPSALDPTIRKGVSAALLTRWMTGSAKAADSFIKMSPLTSAELARIESMTTPLDAEDMDRLLAAQ